MNRAEIIEGLKEVYYRLYAITDHRKTLEACLKLLENENALLDKVLEIIESVSDDWLEDNCEWDWHGEMKSRVLALRGEQE